MRRDRRIRELDQLLPRIEQQRKAVAILLRIPRHHPIRRGGVGLYRVRGVSGVEWAVPLYKGQTRAKTETGHFWQSIVIGVDDQSLVGVPAKMLQGNLADLRRPDSIIIDDIGYGLLWPGEPKILGREIEMNDRRAIVVGICDVSSPFFTEVEWMAQQGISAGFPDGTWHPTDQVTRQAIARFLFVAER